MSSGARAVMSVVMLAGFVVVAALQICLVGIPVLLALALLPGSVAAQVGVPLISATLGVTTYATWRALHLRRSEPAGVPVSRADAPRLWAMLDDAARVAGTRPPDTVTVVAEAAATLSERTRLLGLVGGRRDLYLGLPLLQAWDVTHLKAVVMHEIAHASPHSGRLAPVAHRGRTAVCRTVPRLRRRNLAAPLLLAYARLYRHIDAPFVRRHELAADALAARFAGPAAMAAVLRDLPLLEAAQRLFYAEYLGPGWQAGHVPDDIFGGFLRVLAARAEELARLRSREPLAAPPDWDTHPPVADRIAALAALTPPSPVSPPAATASTPDPAATVPAATVPAASASAASAASASASPRPAPPDVASAGSGSAGFGSTGSGSAGSGSAGSGSAGSGSGASGSAGHASGAPGSAGPTSSSPGAGSASAGSASAAAASAGPESAEYAPGGPWSAGSASAGGLATAGRAAAAGRPDAQAVESAGDLVPDLPDLGRALQRVAFPPQGRTSVSWDEFFGAARTAEMQREADAALGALSRAAATPVDHADEVLNLAADGRLRKAVETVFPGLPPESAAERVGDLVTLLLALAALRCGAARWRHSWTGTAELVAPDGAGFDLGEIAALAGSPETVGAARDLATRRGIDLTAAGQVGSARTASRAEVVGGLVNLVVDGARSDLLIVDTGLFLVPGVPRSQAGSAKRRLAGLAAAAESQRQAAVPGSRFVPYEDVTNAAQIRRTPKAWELTLRDGGVLSVRTALGSDELPGGWAALDEAVIFLSGPR